MVDFSFLVISDLHMHAGKPSDEGAPSYLSSQPIYSKPLQNPILDASILLKENNIRPDWVLCPGDLIDKNDSAQLSNAWGELNQLRTSVHAKNLFGAVGNHDLDSRRSEGGSLPSDQLKALTPKFPIKSQQLSGQYWSKGYCIKKSANLDASILLLNSCMFHGIDHGQEIEEKELNKGKISDSVLKELRTRLRQVDTKFNIAMLHHHIRKHPFLAADNSELENGAELIEILGALDSGWLIVHGHQHYPNLGYQSVGGNNIPILSAASIAAKPYIVRGSVPRNQMHLVDFKSVDNQNGKQLRGSVRSWDWAPNVGWTLSGKLSGLPHSSGFGSSEGTQGLADRAKNTILSQDIHRMKWDGLRDRNSDYQYLTPDDLDAFKIAFQAMGGEIAFDEHSVPLILEVPGNE